VISFIDDGIAETMNKFNRDFLSNENNLSSYLGQIDK
jgi:hypothetical protein